MTSQRRWPSHVAARPQAKINVPTIGASYTTPADRPVARQPLGAVDTLLRHREPPPNMASRAPAPAPSPMARQPSKLTVTGAWTPPMRITVRRDAVDLPECVDPVRQKLRDPRLMQYNRLIASVAIINLIGLVFAIVVGGWWSSGPSDLRAISAAAQANLVLAVMPRQPWVINFVGWLATRPSTRVSLRLRWAFGKYYHLGGLHVGAALAGTFWYLLFVGSLLVDRFRGVGSVSMASIVVSGLVVSLFIVMAFMAMPARRSKNHDRFEVTHRFFAWIALALVWLNAVLLVVSQRGFGTSLPLAMATSPTVLLLCVTTVCAIWPWMLLRRVPITIERPSSHAALVKLDYGSVPPVGTTRPISRHPLVGWHHFANVPAAEGRSGYRMVISRAGDWTSEFIDDPPDHVWVRGLPAVGVANVKRLFTGVVFVVTGSGIGPALGHLLTSTTPSQLVWITRSPRETYGDALVDEILTAQPNAIVWNSDKLGKPDVLRLAYSAYVDSGAEAVICISNKNVTWKVVEGMERRGIPAFGPIWDS